MSADPHNAYNIEHYLWVLEEPAPRACVSCGTLFDPWYSYEGDQDRGQKRLYCSRQCANRVRWARRRARLMQRWGSAA